MEDNSRLLIIPDVPEEEAKSADYSVRINGQEMICQVARVSAFPFNSAAQRQRPIDQTELASFVVFEMGEPVDVEIIARRAFSNAVLRPISKKIPLTIAGNTIRFTIHRPGQYSLELDGRSKNLTIFANPIKAFALGSDTLYFGPGIHFADVLELHSGQTLYIDRDAVVYAKGVYAVDCENIRIVGYGILDLTPYERTWPYFPHFLTGDGGNVLFKRCNNVRVDGVILRNPAWWSITSVNCTNLHFDNVKLIGLWRYNTDGMDFANCQNVKVTNCFIRSFDDSIAIKGMYLIVDGKLYERYDHMSVQNILIENCVVWCDWGGALEIGAETMADEYANIVYRNCDVIHCDQSPVRIHSTGRAEIHDVIYEDIRAEYSKYDTNPVLQTSEDQVYVPDGEPYVGAIIRAFMYWSSGLPDEPKYKTIHDITYRNIQIIKDDECPMPVIGFHGAEENHGFYNILIDGLYCNGKRLTEETASWHEAIFVSNLEFR